MKTNKIVLLNASKVTEGYTNLFLSWKELKIHEVKAGAQTVPILEIFWFKIWKSHKLTKTWLIIGYRVFLHWKYFLQIPQLFPGVAKSQKLENYLGIFPKIVPKSSKHLKKDLKYHAMDTNRNGKDANRFE